MEALKLILGVFMGLFAIGGMLTCGAVVLAGSKAAQVGSALNEAKEERAVAALRCVVEDTKYISDEHFMRITGTIRNYGDTPADYVKVKATFVDKNKNIVDTDWTYAVAGQPLLPKEAKSFAMSTPANRRAVSAKVEVVTD